MADEESGGNVAGSSSCQGLSDSSIAIKRKKTVRAALASGVVLSEDDVPGAKLADKDPSKLKVKDLDRWLICRNLSTKGNKAEKVERINAAIAHEAQFGPLEIVDPDEESHLAKKPAPEVVSDVVPIRPDLNRDKPRRRSFDPKTFNPLVFDTRSKEEYVEIAISHLSKIEGSHAQLLFSTRQKLQSCTKENEEK